MIRVAKPYDVVIYDPGLKQNVIQQRIRYVDIPKVDPVVVQKIADDYIVPCLRAAWDGFVYYGLMSNDDRERLSRK